MKKILVFSAVSLLIMPVVIAVACLLRGDPRGNHATFEEIPLDHAVLPPESAMTLAQIRLDSGEVSTLLVVDKSEETILAVDLFDIGVPHNSDVFEVTSHVDPSAIITAYRDKLLRQQYSIAQLLPAGGIFDRHIATGTNFSGHAKEANSRGVFNFPKFGPATPARTTVVRRPGVLLDYEVELCVRFDRDIRSVEDFDAAQKGFFLCADFTNRAILTRLVDPDNYNSGSGFSDSKSGRDFYPTGPFIVIPNDWKEFISSERMTTVVNGAARQDARGGEMILDFRQLAMRVLDHTQHPDQFLYKNSKVPLVIDRAIPRGAALMSGTSEGVIFMPPTNCDILAGAWSAIINGQIGSREAIVSAVKERFIRSEMDSGHFLQVGDVIEHQSSSMGDIRIKVVPLRTMDEAK